MKKIILLLVLILTAIAAPLLIQAQSYTAIPFVQNQWFKSNGTVAAGYKMCTYAAGTTTPATTYSTSTGTSNTNPVTLDSAGRANIFLAAASYKFILYAPGASTTCNGAAVGSVIWSEDNIPGYSIALNLSTPLVIAQGGTGNNLGVRLPVGFGATGAPTCTGGGGTDSYISHGAAPFQSNLTVTPEFVSTTNGTVGTLLAYLKVVVPASETATFTVLKNDVATALTCSIAAAGATCQDTTHTFSITVFDRLSMKLNCAGGVTALGAISSSVAIVQQ